MTSTGNRAVTAVPPPGMPPTSQALPPRTSPPRNQAIYVPAKEAHPLRFAPLPSIGLSFRGRMGSLAGPSADSDIQQDLGYLSHRYHCEEILVLAKASARELLRKVVQDDFARGFDDVQVTSRDEGKVPFVQLNLANSAYLRRTPAGTQSVRPYRVVKREDGQFALYGHLALYEAKRAVGPAHDTSFPRTTEGLTKELLTIGTVEEGLLPPQGSELRGRIESIGVSLNARGGKELMLKVHAVVRENLDSARARELERAWDGVGDWEGQPRPLTARWQVGTKAARSSSGSGRTADRSTSRTRGAPTLARRRWMTAASRNSWSAFSGCSRLCAVPLK
jgi:hypothetical protein